MYSITEVGNFFNSLDLALWLNQKKMSPIPIAPNTKIPPRGFRWKQYQRGGVPVAMYPEIFTPDRTVGVLGGVYNHLIFDCDDSRYLDWVSRLGETLTVKTKRGLHWEFETPVPVRTRFQFKKTLGLEIKGIGAYALAPYARLGDFVYEPIGNTLDIRKIELDEFKKFGLILEPWTAEIQERQQPEPVNLALVPTDETRVELSLELYRMFEGYRGLEHPSELDAKIIFQLSKKFDLSQIRFIFNRLAPSGHKFRERKDDYLGRTYQNVTTWKTENLKIFVASNPRSSEMSQLAQDAMKRLQPFPGRTGLTDQQVLLAHLEIVKKTGKEPHALGVREGEEQSGFTWNTFRKSNKRLMDRGLLQRIGKDEFGTTTWRLNFDRIFGLNQSRVAIPVLLNHGAWVRSALGKASGQIFYALRDQPMTPKEIVKATGRGIRTVYRCLDRLEFHKMVQKIGKRWHTLPIDLDEIAEILGTLDIPYNRRLKHQNQRKRLAEARMEAEKRRLELRAESKKKFVS